MVPLSERRHRIQEHEIPEVVEGLKLRLSQLLEEREEEDKAEIAFRICPLNTRQAGEAKISRFLLGSSTILHRFLRR